MSPKLKKILIIGGLGTISIALAFAYIQYQKIMNYVIKFKRAKIKKFDLNTLDFDLFLDFKNNSDLAFVINSQSYSVYMNNVFITKISNSADVKILPNANNAIGLNIKLNPGEVVKTLNKNILELMTKPEKIMIKVDVKMSVSMYGLPISIPFVYESTLKELTTTEKS